MTEEKKPTVETSTCTNRLGSLKCAVDPTSLNICLPYNETRITTDSVSASRNASHENTNLHGNRKHNANIALTDKKVNGKFHS